MGNEEGVDPVWDEQMERMGKMVAEGYPELSEAARIELMEDWLYCNNSRGGDTYIERCFQLAIEMFSCEVTLSREPEDFVEFIKPALRAFFGEEGMSDATLLALIRELVWE